MSEYSNELSGVLFRNDRKDKDTQPDYNGTCQIEGVEYFMNAWVKESKKDGRKFFSFSFKAKDTPSHVPPVIDNDINDDLPF
jgi:hypothetical protein